MLRSLIAGLVVMIALCPAAAFAQDAKPATPAMPDTLQNLAAKGAQIRYLGREKGMDGWIAIQQGQEQYFYVSPDGEATVMGLLFDKAGKLLTVRQVQNLQAGKDPTLESLVVDSAVPPTDSLAKLQEQIAKEANKDTTPAQRMFAEIEGSNWISIGKETAPVIYAFLDPQCPHCHEFMKDLRKDFIDAGQVQLRMIPVGFRDDTKAQAAVLLAAPNAKELWYRHLDGDPAALPISTEVNKQAVELNMSIMQTWKMDATPMIIYRSSKGEIKIIRGRPKNPIDILNDLS